MDGLIDLMAILNIFALYVLLGTGLRILLGWLLPKGLMEAGDSVILAIRLRIINMVEGLWPDRENAEVVILSRLIAPFVLMLLFESGIMLLMTQITHYYAIYLLVQALHLFVFMNVAPSIDDWKTIFASTGFSKSIFLVKTAIAVSAVTYYEQMEVVAIDGISNILLMIVVIIFPMSSWGRSIVP